MVNRSRSEESLGERFSNREITSDEEFIGEILGVYGEVCGDYGKKTFTSQVIPRLQALYGNNYRKMGEIALDIIDEGSSKKTSKIDEYFSSVSVKELETKRRMLSMSDIEKIICDTILECEEEFQSKYSSHYNVVGAVVYGSYAQGNQQPNSDLDILYLVRWENPEGISDLDRLDYVDDFDLKTDFDFCEHFKCKIRRQLRLVIDDFGDSVVLDNKDILLDLLYGDSNIIEGKYQVVSPFKWVHDKVAGYTADRK